MSLKPETIKFLKQLAKNNNREWFNRNKEKYESDVREPAFELIESLAGPLKKISPHFLALAKKTGGSLMRVFRDTRFSKDKTPYKTNIGIHFRHEFGKDVHAPGYYIHVSPTECFLGLGIWHPDSEALKKIRDQIVDEPAKWKRVVNNKAFQSGFELAGNSLKKAPLGFDKEHPLIDDLKRKDFIAITSVSESQVTSAGFKKTVVDTFKKGNGLMRFLCDSLKVPF